MIYLRNDKINNVITDSQLGYIPKKINVYLDNIFIGELDNTSIEQRYINISFELNDFNNKEYYMKLFDKDTLIKRELVVVDKPNTNDIISTNSNNKIIQYERKST